MVPPENFEIVGCQRCDFMYFGGQNNTKKVVYDHGIRHSKYFKWYFLLKFSQSVSLNYLLFHECKF